MKKSANHSWTLWKCFEKWLLFCGNVSWERLSSLTASPTCLVEAAGRPGFLLEFLLHPVRHDCLHPAACGRSLSSRLPAAAHSTGCWQHFGTHCWSTAAPAHHMTKYIIRIHHQNWRDSNFLDFHPCTLTWKCVTANTHTSGATANSRSVRTPPRPRSASMAVRAEQTAAARLGTSW